MHWNLLGFKWKDKYYYPIILMFGGKLAPYIFTCSRRHYTRSLNSTCLPQFVTIWTTFCQFLAQCPNTCSLHSSCMDRKSGEKSWACHSSQQKQFAPHLQRFSGLRTRLGSDGGMPTTPINSSTYVNTFWNGKRAAAATSRTYKSL